MSEIPERRSASRAFRAALKRELPRWIADGLVDPAKAEALSARYGLPALQRESGNQVARSIFGIGSLLIGGGLIAFVAAHWTRLGVPWKTLLLFVLLLGLHGTGWRLWRTKSPRLGEMLILTACLAFGANLALFAQMFHIQRDQTAWLAAWALGAAAVAWAVRSSWVGLLVVVLSFVWLTSRLDVDPHAFSVYPFLIAFGLLPLAYVARAPWLQGSCLLAIGLSLVATAAADAESSRAAGLAALAGSLLIWATGHFHRARDHSGPFGFPDVIVGAVALALTAYMLSFHEAHQSPILGDRGRLWIVPTASGFVAVAALLFGAARAEPWRGARRLTILGVLGSAVAVAVSLFTPDRGATVLANVGAFALAAIGIGNGVSEDRRSVFWLGTLFAVLLVLTRFFEYDTSLLAKSLVFIACGVAVVLVGVRFERHLRRKEASNV